MSEMIKRVARAICCPDGCNGDTGSGRPCDIERADIEGLRKSIQDYLDGDYPNPRKHRYDESDDKCPHCRYWYEDCGACIEEHFILELKS